MKRSCIKNLLGLVTLAATLAIFAGGLTGCGPKSEPGARLAKPEFNADGEDLTGLSPNSVLLEGEGGLKLCMDENGVIMVLDAQEKVLWSSGIGSPELLANMNNVDTAVSLAAVNYQLNNESNMALLSGPEAFKKEQFRIYKKDNVLTLEQILGEFTENLLLPEALSEERFQSLLGKIDELDAGFLNRQYAYYTPETAKDVQGGMLFQKVPELKNKPFYVLMDIRSQSARTRIHDAFTQAGYTSADMEQDRQDAGIKITDHGTVFKVVTEYYFENGELVVEIPCDRIYYPEGAPLVNIDLFKYGVYMPQGSKGYYMAPSGSGALFEFGTGKTANYTLGYLGEDYTNILYSDQVDYSGYPVYGLTDGGAGYLAVIESGAENIRLRIEGEQDGYIMYPQLEILRTHRSSLGRTRQFYIYDTVPYHKTVRIRYAFLNGEQATYSGMAEYYRDYLKKSGALAEKPVSENLPFGMEIINIIKNSKETGGFKFTAEQAVTTFDRTREIIGYFKSKGLNTLHVKLNGANKGGLFIQQPGVFKAGGKAGGKKGYIGLKEYCDEVDVQMYLNLNLPFMYEDSFFDGYKRNSHTSRLLNNKPAVISYKEKSTFADRSDLAKIEVVSPYYYEGYAADYLKNKSFIGAGVSVGELSRILNSDFSKERYSPRSVTLERVSKSLEALSGGFKLMGENPGTFALPFISYGEKVPMTGAGYAVFEKDIPFIQMLIHGSMDYTSMYWNNADNREIMRLKAIETGSGVSYRFADEVSKDVMKMQNNFLYNVSFKVFKEKAIEDYQYVSKALEGLNQTPIIGHRYLSDKLVMVSYEGGEAIYINYADSSAQADGYQIPAKGYLRVKRS